MLMAFNIIYYKWFYFLEIGKQRHFFKVFTEENMAYYMVGQCLEFCALLLLLTNHICMFTVIARNLTRVVYSMHLFNLNDKCANLHWLQNDIETHILGIFLTIKNV